MTIGWQRQKKLKVKTRFILLIIIILSIGFILCSKFNSKDNIRKALKIGVTDGIPQVIMSKVAKEYGEDNIELESIEMYTFQDC